MPSCFAPGPRQGLTLVELLAAVAILALLVGVVFLVYGTVLNTLRNQAVGRESLEPAAEALDALQRDLLGALALRGATNPPFILAPAGEGAPETFTLRLFTAWPGEGSNDWRTYGIREVEYALRKESAAEAYALVRRRRPFRVPPPAAEAAAASAETLLRPVAGVQILVYDGNAWTNAWGAGAAAGALPKAARISLRIGDPSAPRTLELETLIPAGNKIKAPARAPAPGAEKSRRPPT